MRCIACDKENVDEGEIERPFGKAGDVASTSADVEARVRMWEAMLSCIDTRRTLLVQP